VPCPVERAACSRRPRACRGHRRSSHRPDRERRPRPWAHAGGPYGFAAESADYDAQIQELVRENRLGELEGWDPAFAVSALADSFWQLLILHGAIGEDFEPELLSYEVPTYFGMLTASFRQD
jgi:aromatic ring-opening dioxygenase LigB subunit